MNNNHISAPINYIKIINWFWDEVPYMENYKAAHAAVFFAIIDGINRNNWQDNTPIAYDRLISKIKVSKLVYLDSRNWLALNGLIDMIPGQNAYHMAAFDCDWDCRFGGHWPRATAPRLHGQWGR